MPKEPNGKGKKNKQTNKQWKTINCPQTLEHNITEAVWDLMTKNGMECPQEAWRTT